MKAVLSVRILLYANIVTNQDRPRHYPLQYCSWTVKMKVSYTLTPTSTEPKPFRNFANKWLHYRSKLGNRYLIRIEASTSSASVPNCGWRRGQIKYSKGWIIKSRTREVGRGGRGGGFSSSAFLRLIYFRIIFCQISNLTLPPLSSQFCTKEC